MSSRASLLEHSMDSCRPLLAQDLLDKERRQAKAFIARLHSVGKGVPEASHLVALDKGPFAFEPFRKQSRQLSLEGHQFHCQEFIGQRGHFRSLGLRRCTHGQSFLGFSYRFSLLVYHNSLACSPSDKRWEKLAAIQKRAQPTLSESETFPSISSSKMQSQLKTRRQHRVVGPPPRGSASSSQIRAVQTPTCLVFALRRFFRKNRLTESRNTLE